MKEGHHHGACEHSHAHEYLHSHSHGHGGHHHHGHHHHHHGSESNIKVAFFLNLFFSLVELVGGIFTGSVAILSDALHDFGDSLSLGLAWYLQRLSKKGRDHKFSYGYKRFSLLSALLISTILLVGSFFVIWASVERLFNPSEPNAEGMFLLAILGVAVNGFAVWRMGGSNTLSDRSLRLHLLEDVLGWIAVLVVSIVMYFVDWSFLDPLLSLAITAWILYNVYFNLRDTFKILLQGVPDDVNQEGLIKEIEALEQVSDVHDVHIWTLNGEDHIGSFHIVCKHQDLAEKDNFCSIKQEIRSVANRYGVKHITIEFDLEGEACCFQHC